MELGRKAWGRTPAPCAQRGEEAEGTRAILWAKRERLERELRDLHDGLSVPGRTRKYERVLERVGRIRERYSRVSAQYDIRVDRDPGPDKKPPGANATALRSQYHAVLRHHQQDFVNQYLEITEVESVFPALKSEPGLRPIWHQGANQIRTHLFIAVLAWYAVHLIRTRLKLSGNNLCWGSIRHRMRNWMRITTVMRQVGAGPISCRQLGCCPRVPRRRTSPGGLASGSAATVAGGERSGRPVGPWAPGRTNCEETATRWLHPRVSKVPTWVDENQAGTADGRAPLGGIPARLDRMGIPRVRLTCREVDGFGANDTDTQDGVA